MNLIICVDKENEDFRKLMNSEIKQGMYTYFLSTGIVFSKNKIYITKSDMMHYSYYRKLKKSFVKMMNISKEDKVKK